MPHAMQLSYQGDTVRVSLGQIGSGEEKTIRIGPIVGDSVTVWATNDNPFHLLSKKFPTHSRERLAWEF